jgi:hypothetical protein
VGVLVLSGLWLYWVHVDGVHQLVTTMYGRTLLVKLIVVAVLVLIGAGNQLWLLPLLDAQRTAGQQGAVAHTVARHFRATVAAEVVLGVGVLFIAPLLSGSARNQAFQASPAALAQTATAGSDRVELTPSGRQPGLIDYTVRVRGGAAPRTVTVTFASTDLDVPAQPVTAAALGDGTYRVSGYYTPVVGDWQVEVRADGGAPATFTLPITARPATLPKAPTPDVRWTTWVLGSVETLLVAGALLSSYRVSRRVTELRVRTTAAPAGPEPQAGLAGA